ncbi:DUF6735 family protein [Natrialbaceae archaeon A-arb3/5]
MSHRALVAEQQPNGKFNIYHSRDGAEEIQLLDELRESLNVHGRVDWESLTGSTMPEVIHQLSSTEGVAGLTAETADTGNVVEPRPVATNRRAKELLMLKDLLQYEVLYVVEDGEVEAYWLTWAYPDVIRPLHRHIEIDVYDPVDVPENSADLASLHENGDPIRTISDFESGWLTDDLVREVVKEYHRWILELQLLSVREFEQRDSEDLNGVPQLLSTPEYWITFRTNETDPLVPQSHPFIVPIRIESPPNASSMRIRDAASQTRFSIGAGLNAAESVSEEEVQQAQLEALMEIIDAHVDRVAPEFIQGRVGTFIEEYQRAPSHRDLKDIWKN